jgi:hypothetical protein
MRPSSSWARVDDGRSYDAPPVVGAAELDQRYDVAVCSIRCVVFPQSFYTLAPAPPRAHVDELCRIERRWEGAATDAQRAELVELAEQLARRVEGRNASASEVETRYKAAVDYVHRSFKAIEPAWWNIIEQHPYELKIAPFKNDLSKIELRWAQAKDKDREAIAHDAELLADHVQESLPGAPQDRKRTNLFKGEVQHSTPATSYGGEITGGNAGAGGSAIEWKKYAVPVGIGLAAIIGLRMLLK